ncbi:hypothetical protein niasHT_002608 [Heterodera trifolii]|uniref:Uncharacterized protein n=1 Tax=Heterodera trifolii TaxID=157864 RepID=A0ABD2M0E5_9BILA
MSAPSAAFFLLTLVLLVPTANAIRCYAGSENKQEISYIEGFCGLNRDGCVKIDCATSSIVGSSIKIKGCLKDKMACGRTYSTQTERDCKVYCCTSDLCNGVLAMQPIAIGRAVLVPLMIGILAAAFGILF